MILYLPYKTSSLAKMMKVHILRTKMRRMSKCQNLKYHTSIGNYVMEEPSNKS